MVQASRPQRAPFPKAQDAGRGGCSSAALLTPTAPSTSNSARAGGSSAHARMASEPRLLLTSDFLRPQPPSTPAPDGASSLQGHHTQCIPMARTYLILLNWSLSKRLPEFWAKGARAAGQCGRASC